MKRVDSSFFRSAVRWSLTDPPSGESGQPTVDRVVSTLVVVVESVFHPTDEALTTLSPPRDFHGPCASLAYRPCPSGVALSLPNLENLCCPSVSCGIVESLLQLSGTLHGLDSGRSKRRRYSKTSMIWMTLTTNVCPPICA